MSNLLTEYSPWYTLLCIGIGAAYAFLLYKKDAPWGKTTNYLLAGIRFLLVTFLCLMLLGPYVRQVSNQFEKPKLVFAIDNSQSIKLVNDSLALKTAMDEIERIGNSLTAKDYEVAFYTLDQEDANQTNPSQLAFDFQQTDLSSMLKRIQSQFENSNLAEIVLFSDGIYNKGISPDFLAFGTPISTIALGDTMPQVDINLKTVYSNKIAYLGNKFPLVAEIANNGFLGKKAMVRLTQGGRELERKNIQFDQENGLQNVDFLLEAQEEGMQHYVIQVLPLDGEFTLQNNTKNVYIDILDSKEKILLVAASPHPDIKAIRSVIEKNKNYDFQVYIPGLITPGTEDGRPFQLEDQYDLVIFHQIPNDRNIGTDVLNRIREKGTSTWFILGNQSDISAFNRTNFSVNIVASGRQIDKVTPNYNSSFDRFTFDDDKRAILAKSPPVSVPFGNFELNGNTEVILYQKVGSITTNKPMLVVSEQNGVKSAVMMGEGIWQWKLQEFASFDKTEAFDEVVSKLIQYLSTKEDKRRFRVYPASDEYFDSETVFFETEVYNTIYEKIYGQKIDLQISNEDGGQYDYTYVNTHPNLKYAVNNLDQGIYSYKATTVLDGQTEVSEGEFTIRKMEVEAINTTANFNLMRNLSRQTGGYFYTTDQLEALHTRLLEKKAPDIIHSQEEFQEIINLEWLLAILLVLATVEWVTRKVRGAY